MEKNISYIMIIIIFVIIMLTFQYYSVYALETYQSGAENADIEGINEAIKSIDFDSTGQISNIYDTAEEDMMGKTLEKRGKYLAEYSNYLYPPQASNNGSKYNLIYNLTSPSLFEYKRLALIDANTTSSILMTNNKCISATNKLDNCNVEDVNTNLIFKNITNETDYNDKITDDKYKITEFDNIDKGKPFIVISPSNDNKKCLTIDENNRLGFEPCNMEIKQKWYIKK